MSSNTSQSYPHLKEQLNNLVQIQELDLKIDSLKKRRASLPAELKASEDAFNRARMSVDHKKNAVTEFEKLERQTRAAIELNQDRVARSGTKLESASNSQEFNAANKEIEQVKKMNLDLEAQIAKFKADIESAQKDLATLLTRFDEVKGKRDAQAADVNGETEKLDTEISSLMGERGKFTPTIDRALMARYDRIRPARAGVGLVPAVGGRCTGCNMMLPPQLYNELQKLKESHQCPSCHRVLFIPQSSA